MGGITGGVASAGFYGAGKGIEKLKESFRAGKGGTGNGYSVDSTMFPDDNYLGSKNMDGNIIIGTRGGQRMPYPTLVGGSNPQVQAAGMAEIRGGKIYSVNNASGHFKPSNDRLGIVEGVYGLYRYMGLILMSSRN